MPRKTTHDYINDYKERLRTAFGEFTGAVDSLGDKPTRKEKDAATEKRQAVDGILAEVTPSDLDEDADSVNGGEGNDTLMDSLPVDDTIEGGSGNS